VYNWYGLTTFVCKCLFYMDLHRMYDVTLSEPSIRDNVGSSLHLPVNSDASLNLNTHVRSRPLPGKDLPGVLPILLNVMSERSDIPLRVHKDVTG